MKRGKQCKIVVPIIKSLSRTLVYEEEEEHKVIEDKNGYCHRIGSALLKNVNDKTVNLFSSLEEDEDKEIETATTTSLSFIDPKGENQVLSTRQKKIILALAECIDKRRENKVVAEYINNLPDKLIYGYTAIPPLPIKFDKRDLARVVYGKQRVGGYEVKAIEQDLITLSQRRSIFKVKNGTDTITFNDHFLTYKSITLDRDGEILKDVSQVTIGDIFLYNLNSEGGYQLAPNTILSLWNAYLNDRELTSFLFTELLSKRGVKIASANKEAALRRKELKKERKQTDEEIDKEVKAVKRKGLTYSITLSTLLGSLRENKRYYRGERLRADNIKTDIKDAMTGLLNMGIVSECNAVTGASGEPKYCFVINEDWLADEVKRLQMKEEEANNKPL